MFRSRVGTGFGVCVRTLFYPLSPCHPESRKRNDCLLVPVQKTGWALDPRLYRLSLGQAATFLISLKRLLWMEKASPLPDNRPVLDNGPLPATVLSLSTPSPLSSRAKPRDLQSRSIGNQSHSWKRVPAFCHYSEAGCPTSRSFFARCGIPRHSTRNSIGCHPEAKPGSALIDRRG